MTNLSAGIACHYDDNTHGYAMRVDDHGVLMCEICADIYDTMVAAIEAFKARTGANPS